MYNHEYRKCNCQNSSVMNDNDDQNIIQESPCNNVCVKSENNCNCGFDMGTEPVFPINPMLAQSYVPIQTMNRVFTPEVGLKMGTIFPELVSPYMPCQSIREIEFIKSKNVIGEGCNK